MKNPNHLNANTEAIPEMNQVVPEPNQVVDIHDPNEMVDIPDDVDIVDYDGDNEENPKEDPEEDPEEEPEPNNGLVNQFAPHVDPHHPGVMIGWLEENDGVNEGVNNEDIEDEDVEIEFDDDAELTFPYEVEFDKTPPPGDVSSDFVSSDSVSSDSDSEDEKVNVAPETTIGTLTQEPYATHTFPRSLFTMGELFPARDSSDDYWFTTVGSETLKITDIGELGKCHIEKRMAETEMKLESTCMEREIVKGKLSKSYGWNKRFYMEMVCIRGVPKPPSDDEDTERPRKKLKKSSSDWDRGIFGTTWNT
ncbi:hypothetical protein Tco_1446813 [Tanacetum coccineum]